MAVTYVTHATSLVNNNQKYDERERSNTFSPRHVVRGTTATVFEYICRTCRKNRGDHSVRRTRAPKNEHLRWTLRHNPPLPFRGTAVVPFEHDTVTRRTPVPGTRTADRRIRRAPQTFLSRNRYQRAPASDNGSTAVVWVTRGPGGRPLRRTAKRPPLNRRPTVFRVHGMATKCYPRARSLSFDARNCLVRSCPSNSTTPTTHHPG